jgi:hypothetical protein
MKGCTGILFIMCSIRLYTLSQPSMQQVQTLTNVLHLPHRNSAWVSNRLTLAPQSEWKFKLLKPTGYVMHQQSNIQQMYALPTLYLCVLYLSENKQRLVPLIS